MQNAKPQLKCVTFAQGQPHYASPSAASNRMPPVSAEDIAYSRTVEKKLVDIKKDLSKVEEALTSREKRVKRAQPQLSQEYKFSQTDHSDAHWDLMMAWDGGYGKFSKIKERLNETRILVRRSGSGTERLRDMQAQ